MDNGSRSSPDPTLAWIVGGLLVAAASGALVGTAEPIPRPSVLPAARAASVASAPHGHVEASAPAGGLVAAAVRDGAGDGLVGVELDPPVRVEDGLDEDERRQWERANAESMKILEGTTPELAGSRR